MFKNKNKFDRYTDPTGEFTNKRLKFSEWYVRNKILLRKIFIGVLLGWSIITISIGLFVWGKYLLFDYTKDEQQVAEMSQNLVSQIEINRQAPEELNVGNQWIFNSSKNKYDLAVEITNPNSRWIAELTYRFSYSGTVTKEYTSMILPGADRFVVAFGIDAPRTPSGVSFEMVDMVWKRINPHDVNDPLVFMSQRLIFSTDEVNFISARREDSLTAHQIIFDIKNNSLFSYTEVPFIAVFTRNSRLTGFAPVLVDTFLGAETRRIEMTSFMDRLDLDDVELQPLLNVFDDGVYLPI